MLENEPDTNQNDAPSDTATANTVTPPPRRRRAATRPAGPPASAADALVITGAEPTGLSGPGEAAESSGAAESTPAEAAAPAKKAAAKRAPRKTAAKKVAAPGEPAADDGTESARPARAPRKRAAKKVTPAEPEAVAVSEAASEAAAAPDAVAEPEAAVESEAAAEPAPVIPAEQQSVIPTEEQSVIPTEEQSVIPTEQQSVIPTEQQSVIPTEQRPDLAAESVPDAVQPEVVEESAVLPGDEAEQGQEVPAEDEAEVGAEAEAGAEEEAQAGAEDEAEAAAEDQSETGADEGAPRRRRRRRGGRRHRRSGPDDDAEDESDTAGEDSDEDGAVDGAPGGQPQAEAAGDAADDDTEEGSEGEADGTRRRRRRRRRRGEDSATAADDPTDVVVRVREPRARKRASQEVTGIDGSTRMEAKRQRRREGREAGRRRAPILSEAEFLARRESVDRRMIIRQRDDLSQIAVLEDDILVEHYVDRDSAASLIGNVYLGRVQNVLPSMEAAFVDIGRGRNAVLYAGEVDWDSFGADGQNRKVEKVLKSGQTILVQVSKDPVGAKGARLTNHISIPGRYIVYSPGGHLSGISRKLPDNERRRLKDILTDLIGDSASVIVRTAAEGASEEELVRDVNRLKAQWEDIERKVKAGNAPQLLYGEPDLTLRIVRDLFTEDFTELLIQGNGSNSDAYDAVDGYVRHVAPHLQDRLRRWDADADGDIFGAHRLDEQIAKALERKVFLPSGGSLIIDRTEAMTVIDVNTGKFTGAGGNLEATVTSNNLEAAEEIVRQLRLRDIGGIIVIDFIDMVLPNNRELLLRRLVECLGRDRTRHQVAEVTSLGLVQMTRKKIGTGLLEAFSIECPHCHGRGHEIRDVPVETQKQADGGTREQRSRDSRRGGQGGGAGGQNGGRQASAANGAGDADDSGPERGQRPRRSRRGRGGSGGDQSASEPTAPEGEPEGGADSGGQPSERNASTQEPMTTA